MKALIITFSGTGNTNITAGCIESSLKSNNIDTTSYKLEKIIDSLNTLNLKKYDYIILGYPIHAFNAPKIVVRFAKLMPQSEGQKIYIFKTSGEPFVFNNSSSYLIYKHLSKKGYQMMFERHFLMPYNIMFRYKKSLVKQMYLLMEEMSKKFADDILLGKMHKLKCFLFGRIISFIFRIQWYGAKFNGHLYTSNKKNGRCF